MARGKDNQVLDPAHDAPVPCSVHLTLIPAVEPAVPKNSGSLLRTVPVPGKNIRPPHDDFLALAQLHLDSGNCRAHAPGINVIRIIHGADSGRLGESANLQNLDPQHHKVELRFDTEWT